MKSPPLIYYMLKLNYFSFSITTVGVCVMLILNFRFCNSVLDENSFSFIMSLITGILKYVVSWFTLSLHYSH